MPRYNLEGQVAIVTGAGRGIGRAIALRLAREGCLVTVADLDGETAAQVAAEIQEQGGQSLAHQADVTSKEEVERMVGETCEQLGSLQILVNNAGIGAVAPLLDTDEKTWDALMNVNAKSVLLCSQAGARQMIEQGGGGRIINNASGAGKIAPGKGIPLGAYAASKHAVVALTKQMGLELSDHGILVNCVCAGIVDTPMWDLIDRETAARRGVKIGAVKAEAVAGIPVGRIQQPEDVANVVAFLASDDASYMTGQTYNVSGGLLPY
ncbi:MAG: glucose 1-dehydrogenase [Caldilineaceae bacterium SB0661_bin_32]|uniref:Glucose 1-dehydrogenase n=1 Tax=Caldilineaceae bacterium SB0661_bin_32 TaxID=2605255 RepID=A0A6B1D8R0_9CHLR|nr:glucose 1-dehydrogenase [Caldilineaceae bacterium SB0661_bin_32]